jgi:O-antigen/teichoic acid export membrane protein
MIMGLLAFFQWPISFYQGGLMGLRRQVLFNGLKVITVTLSNGGALLILWLVSPTIEAFLLWQVAISAVQAVSIAFFLWTSLPRSERAPRFDLAIVRNVWRFAAGMSGITLTSLILTQLDKLLVSKLLSLEIFGYYSLAWAVASGLQIIAGAVFYVIFPRMSAQVAAGDEAGLKQSYHRSSQLIAILVLPAALVLSLFSFEVLQLWTRNVQTAHYAAPIVSVLVIGSAINGLLQPPYALQLAFGWTKLTLLAGLLSIAIAIPVLFAMTKHFGPVGAASVWAGLNIINMLVAVPIMHRRLLRHEVWGYFGDIGLPLASTLGVAALSRLVLWNFRSPLITLISLTCVWVGGLVTAVLAAPQIRVWILTYITKQKPTYA